MNLLIAFCGAVIAICAVGALLSMGAAAWSFCNPKPSRPMVRRRESVILGADGKKLEVWDEA